jgi:hypothetical protein
MMSNLLERSQMKSRTLLEKKEALMLEILHLETLNTDLESMNMDVKKELWFTSNALNRVQGKYEQLQQSSKFTEERLNFDIMQMKIEYVALQRARERRKACADAGEMRRCELAIHSTAAHA